MKKIILIITLIIFLISTVGCTHPQQDLSKLPWREFTVTLDSGKVLTFCSVHAVAKVNFSNRITDIIFYNKDGEILALVNDKISSISFDSARECQS